MKNNLLLILCPPYWQQLPHPGLAYLNAYLKKHDYNPIILDLNIYFYNKLILSDRDYKKDWTVNSNYTTIAFINKIINLYPEIIKKIFKIIDTNNIKFIGFSNYINNINFSYELTKIIKNKYNHISIIFGGPQTFFIDNQKTFNDYNKVDYFVIGEGEIPLLQIISGSSKKKIYKYQQNDNLVYDPDYSCFNLKNYNSKNTLPIIISRGCVKKCNFCTERLLYNGYRKRPIANIIDEIKNNFIYNNIRHFIFYDSMLNADLAFFKILIQNIIKLDLDLTWEAQIGITKKLSLKDAINIKKSGCVNLFIGFESGSDKILSKMNKRYSLADASDFFNKLNKANLFFEISLIVNYPGETDIDFNNTLNFIRNNSTIKKIAQINNFKNYPGLSIDNTADIIYNNNKINLLIKLLIEKKIKYTPVYINNLLDNKYGNPQS